MIAVDWNAVLLGVAIGTVMSAVYFAGLGYGMRLALRTASPVRILAFSAAIRIAALLAVGWIAVEIGGAWAFAGYGISFFVVRSFATTVARAGVPSEGVK